MTHDKGARSRTTEQGGVPPSHISGNEILKENTNTIQYPFSDQNLVKTQAMLVYVKCYPIQ